LSAPKSPRLVLSADTGLSSTDRITSDRSILVTGIIAGATWQYSLNSGKTWKRGSGSKFRVKPGSYGLGQVQVRQTSGAGQTSAPFRRFAAFTVDTKVKAPSLSLAQDTGASKNDRLTSDGTIRVLRLEQGATWEYSLNGGSTWLKGSGSTFNAPAGTYANGQVRVRQLDLAGNLSTAQTSFAGFTVDTQVRVPEMRLVHDAGIIGDRITNVNELRVTGLESGATWSYSLDGGSTWAKGSGNSFTVSDGRYARGQVQVRQTDLAGNVSQPLTSFAAFTIDTEAPSAPTIAFLEDTGVSSSDRITNQPAILVGGLERGATWQFSINGGETWTNDEGLGFAVPEGRYSTGQVRVRQVDVAGNRSRPSTSFEAFTVDLTPPIAPGLALGSDNGQINVLLLESGATWEYSLNSGVNWIQGTGSSFVVDPGTYLAGQVQARQADVAGNQGPANTGFQGFTVQPPLAPLVNAQSVPLASTTASVTPSEGDVVIGTPDKDTFSWANLTATSLARYDVIVGYSSDDQLAVNGLQYSRTLQGSVGHLQALSEQNISNLLNGATLPASDAAAFTVAGLDGTFVALNDQRSAFQSDSDGLVFLKGYTIGSGQTVTIV